jgi:hypothetical protein
MTEPMKPIEVVRKRVTSAPVVTKEGDRSPTKTERTIDAAETETAPIEEVVVRRLVVPQRKVDKGDDRSPMKTERGLGSEGESETSETK